MSAFDRLPGGAALGASLQNALAGRFPQTVLLTGEDSAALAAYASVLAAALLCEDGGARPCGVCSSCRKAAAGVHPDLTIIDEGENELKVELARRIKAENAVIPNDGARRVTVIHHAQNLNPAAQNALLKELEEPPAFAFFLLTAEQPGALLETVRSRCMKFSLEPPRAAADDAESTALLAPYLAALAAGREEGLMQAALAMEKTPRELFMHERRQAFAYADRDVQLKGDRFMFEPMVEAKLLQEATPNEDDFALVLQAGTGYGAVLLSQMTKAVVALEKDDELYAKMQHVVEEMKLDNVAAFNRPWKNGFASQAPFDLIFIEGVVHALPENLFHQLGEGGRLVCVVAEPPAMTGTVFKVVKKNGNIGVFQQFTCLLMDFCHTKEYKNFSFEAFS